MAAFKPGQSLPAVRMPIFLAIPASIISLFYIQKTEGFLNIKKWFP
jgi:hypothetical protein